MATQNGLNLSLSGKTGTGTFVGSAGATLTTATVNGLSSNTGTSTLVGSQTPTIDSPVVTTILTLTAGQIAFPATQVPSAGANVLDDYEEGTWTPNVGGSATYTSQVALYTKVGRSVYVQMVMTINSIGSGSALTILGLPFTASSGQEQAGSMGYFTALSSNVSSIMPYVSGSSANFNFNIITVAATAATNNPNIMQNSTSVNISATYS